MIEIIKNTLLNLNEIDGWKIVENKIEAKELFFIKKELEMNRSKDVQHFKVTVYKDFKENGVNFRGSSATNIHPTMNEEEINMAIKEAAFAASFVKNEYYPLVKPTDSNPLVIKSNFSSGSLSEWLPQLTEAIFKYDNLENGCINSAELFINNIYTRIINSEGVDVSFSNYKGELEFITNWKEHGEEVELYKLVGFSDFNPEAISQEIKNMLTISREKALAQPTPGLKSYTVLLTGEPVKEFFNYYYMQSNAQFVYEGISTSKLNENIQGDNVEGDSINIELDPVMANSTASSPYDFDGFPLNPVTIFKNGVLNKYWCDNRHAYYLNTEPTGLISNLVVSGGSKSVDSLKKEPYLELVAFSDFQMDTLTGDFAGEIRLGWHFDGENRTPVTGGSISGNIKDVQQKMYLSKEIQKFDKFVGPKTIQLFNVSLSGNE